MEKKGFFNKVDTFLKKVAEKDKEYRANAPIREKAKIESLNRKIKIEKANLELKKIQEQKKEITRKKLEGFGSGGSGGFSIGLRDEKEKKKPGEPLFSSY